MDAGDYIMVAGTLQSGQKPQKGDRFRILRNNKEGSIEDSTSLGDALGAAVQAGASVNVIGSGSSLNIQVSFTTSDLIIDDIQKGDIIKSLDSSGCFIATVAFGDPNCSELITLRNFRDEVLIKKPIGKYIITIYYKLGPHIASLISRSKNAKLIIRRILYHIINMLS